MFLFIHALHFEYVLKKSAGGDICNNKLCSIHSWLFAEFSGERYYLKCLETKNKIKRGAAVLQSACKGTKHIVLIYFWYKILISFWYKNEC